MRDFKPWTAKTEICKAAPTEASNQAHQTRETKDETKSWVAGSSFLPAFVVGVNRFSLGQESKQGENGF